jgi:hypothetical protein
MNRVEGTAKNTDHLLPDMTVTQDDIF